MVISKIKANKTSKDNWFIFLLITIISVVVWHKIINQTPLGEGYYYFSEKQSFIYKGDLSALFNLDNFARLAFGIISPIFKGNIKLYMIFELLTATVLYLVFYLVILKITKSKLIGLLATIFFLSNYIGSFDLLAAGEYQRFIQRIPNFIPLLLSLYYLVKHYENTIKTGDRFLRLSYILFAVSVFMGHFSSFMLPIFFLYPLMNVVNKKNIFNSLIFLIITVALISFDTIGGDNQKHGNLTNFLFRDRGIERVLYQIPVVTFPTELIKWIAKNLFTVEISYPYTKVVSFLLLPTILVYISTGLLLYKRKSLNIKFYFAVLLGMLGSMFLYAYYDDRLNPLINIGQERYYFIPSLYSAIIWAFAIKTLIFPNKKITQLILSFIIVSLYLFYNTKLIWKNSDLIQYKFEAMKRYFNYLEVNNYRKDTVMVVPYYFIAPEIFVKKYYGYNEVKFILLDQDWKNNLTNYAKKNIIMLEYDYGLDPLKEPDPQKGKLNEIFIQKQ